jgi:hypothetical protein
MASTSSDYLSILGIPHKHNCRGNVNGDANGKEKRTYCDEYLNTRSEMALLHFYNPSVITLTVNAKLSSSRIMFAASLDTSEQDMFIQISKSAFLRAGESITPLPVLYQAVRGN